MLTPSRRPTEALAGLFVALSCAGCGGDDGGGGGGDRNLTSDGTVYGETLTGGEFHLGPVDWEESEWHNACAPLTKYAPDIREMEGDLLAALWDGIPDVASYCDACIQVTTGKGKTALLRVVSYGQTTPNSIDVSPEAYAILDTGEYPRQMSFEFAKCPDTGKIVYEFQSASSEWWTSLWVRNARVPIQKVEVESKNHGSFVELRRSGDGTLTDDGGFGQGAFTVKLTGMDGQVVTDDFEWPANGIADAVLEGAGNFE